MISFTCDYTEGAHPLILQRLVETNLIQEDGYGEDSFCLSAKQKILSALQCPQAKIYFLTGGTQANSTVIDAMLRSYEGVVAPQTGHIAVHEAGAVEFSGHKVLTVPQHHGKMDPEELHAFLAAFHADPTAPHMVYPGMVYMSFPTEYGTLYSKQELTRIYAICKEFGAKLFIDGARLGYGLQSDSADITLPELARLCDAFTIGGTKVGALCGEAVIFPTGEAPEHFFTIIKQHGALVAKGRLLGVQFDTLFTDGLYFKIARNAIERAMELKKAFIDAGYRMYIDSPTNQQFPILSDEQIGKLKGKVKFEIWEPLPDGKCVTRFATSWATPAQNIVKLKELL